MSEQLTYCYIGREDHWSPPARDSFEIGVSPAPKWPDPIIAEFAGRMTSGNWDYANGFAFNDAVEVEQFAMAAQAYSISYSRVDIDVARAKSVDPFGRYLLQARDDDSSVIERKFEDDCFELRNRCTSCRRVDFVQKSDLAADYGRLKGYDIFKPDCVGGLGHFVVSQRLRDLFEVEGMRGVRYRPVRDVSKQTVSDGSRFWQLETEPFTGPVRIAKGRPAHEPCAICRRAGPVTLGWITSFVEEDALGRRDACDLTGPTLFPDESLALYETGFLLISGRMAGVLVKHKATGVYPFMEKPFRYLLRGLPKSNPHQRVG